MLKNPNGHVPDILDCIANLSSDEIFTPPDVANDLLDLLPAEVWSNPELKFLDPACKTGVFLRECARRLMEGLSTKIPDEETRRHHVFTEMLHGIAITELTGMVSRRSLYYTKNATNEFSVTKFENPDGNIQYMRSEHQYQQGKCSICGSPYENLERGESLENYAYQFIHKGVASDMKFDVVIGNPPYQVEDGGQGRSASPIYQLFVDQAFRLKPRYVAMIIPSRWFAGGKGLDSFREQMLASTNFRYLVDYPDASDLFPSVQIKGGVCYFLWDEKYDGTCKTKTVQSGKESPVLERYLGEHGDVFIRFNEALPILKKVQAKNLPGLDEQVSSSKPFGFRTNFTDYSTTKKAGMIELYGNGGVYFVQRKKVEVNEHWIDEWKVLLPALGPGNDGYPHKILGQPIVASPESCCTETYVVAGVFKTKKEADNFAAYCRTRFFRFLVALRKNTQHATKRYFKFVPELDMKKKWTDEDLYKEFSITDAEQSFVESIVREMTPNE